MRRKLILTALAILLLSFASVLAAKQYRSLQKTRDSKINNLEKQVTKLQEKMQALEEKNEELRTTIEIQGDESSGEGLATSPPAESNLKPLDLTKQNLPQKSFILTPPSAGPSLGIGDVSSPPEENRSGPSFLVDDYAARKKEEEEQRRKEEELKKMQDQLSALQRSRERMERELIEIDPDYFPSSP